MLCVLCTYMVKKSLSYLLSLSVCLIIALIIIISCQDTSPSYHSNSTTTHLGFYHWQTNFDLNPRESEYIDSLGIDRCYIKFFDVDWDFQKQQATPHASLEVSASLPASIQIVPTVFITNRTFQHISDTAIDLLSERIADKILQQCTNFPTHHIQFIQIDCDWSLSTKAAYFSFLQSLQDQLSDKNIQLSATIRLHQIKYVDRTGIPPVAKGLLMFYNMGEVSNPTTVNSILDLAIAKKYTTSLSQYPMHLDLGLPLFQWGVLFRNGKMIQLINQLQDTELADSTRFVATSSLQWEVLKDTYLNGLFLYEGDFIRLERVTKNELLAAAELLQIYFSGKEFDLLLYHLEESVLADFSVADLKEVEQVFIK